LICIWRELNGKDNAPESGSDEWRAWLLSELARPLDSLPVFSLPDETARSTFGLFLLVADMIDKLDRDAFGHFILSHDTIRG
jgi:Phosphoenolpyruvate carboxylase